jgi:hypothetical protein
MTVWLSNMPLSPSVNKSLDVAIVRKMNIKTGNVYTGGQFRSTPEMRHFKKMVQLYKNRHETQFLQIKRIADEWLTQGFVLRVDVYAVINHDRVFSNPNRKVLQLDANNFLKGQLDAVANCLGIDDKFFFSDHIEKVTCDPGEQECAMVRITPMRPRRATDVRNQMMAEAKT